MSCSGRHLISAPSVGVGFFFILSGFVLALNYKHKIIDQPHFSYKNFYIARMARIYPLHVLTFAVMIPLVIVQGLFGWDKALSLYVLPLNKPKRLQVPKAFIT